MVGDGTAASGRVGAVADYDGAERPMRPFGAGWRTAKIQWCRGSGKGDLAHNPNFRLPDSTEPGRRAWAGPAPVSGVGHARCRTVSLLRHLHDAAPMPDEPIIPDATPLQPALKEAERLLRESLGEVCATDPARADTGEMIRLDEMLAIAGEAAKRAVSLRRRMRQEGRPASPRAARRRSAGAPESNGNGRAADATRTAVEGAALRAADAESRTFRDGRGVVWSVWAVYPQSGSRKAGLRGSYANGWLTFVCEAEKRRLSPVPEDWMTADDSTLEALLLAAEVARPEATTRRMRPIKGDGNGGSAASDERAAPAPRASRD